MRKLVPPFILIGAALILLRGAFSHAPVWIRSHSGIALAIVSLAAAFAITLVIWLAGRSRARSARTFSKPLYLLTEPEFEQVVFQLLTEKGYACRHTGQTGDQGVDVIAQKGGELLAVQAKRWRNNVGNFAVQAVHAGKDYYGCQRALLITTSYLTRSAKDAAGRLQVAYMEAPDVQAWLETSSLAHILRNHSGSRPAFCERHAQ